MASAPDRFLRCARLRAAREVVALDLGRGEPVPVPRHGRLLMIWTGRAPVVRALGPQGEEIAVDVVPGPRGIAAVPVCREGPTPFDPGAGVPGPAPPETAP